MLALVSTPWSLLPSWQADVCSAYLHTTCHTAAHWHTTGTQLARDGHARYSLLPRLRVKLTGPLVQDFGGLILQHASTAASGGSGSGGSSGGGGGSSSR
jgi:uncharacterized membrane protein YgcG